MWDFVKSHANLYIAWGMAIVAVVLCMVQATIFSLVAGLLAALAACCIMRELHVRWLACAEQRLQKAEDDLLDAEIKARKRWFSYSLHTRGW